MVDFRIIIPVICIISITVIIFLIVFRRAAFRRGLRVRRVHHHPHSTCATYTVPGCETIHACPQPSYPYAAQPAYYQNPASVPPQQLYPQAYPQQTYPQAQNASQPPYPSAPASSQPQTFSSPPPYYPEAQK